MYKGHDIRTLTGRLYEKDLKHISVYEQTKRFVCSGTSIGLPRVIKQGNDDVSIDKVCENYLYYIKITVKVFIVLV